VNPDNFINRLGIFPVEKQHITKHTQAVLRNERDAFQTAKTRPTADDISGACNGVRRPADNLPRRRSGHQ